MTHVTLASPQPLLLCGMRTALSVNLALRVDHVDADPDALVDHYADAHPDIVVLDGQLAGEGTPALLRRLRQRGLRQGVVFIDAWTGPCKVQDATCRELDALLHCDDPIEEFCRAVDHVACGNRYRSRRVAELLNSRHGKSVRENRLERLTSTERQVYALLGRNLTSREIAEELFISYRTVQKHRDNITRKLDLHGSNALLAFALRHPVHS